MLKDNSFAEFDKLIDQLESVPERQLFAKSLREIREAGNDAAGGLSEIMLGWARQHLGADYLEILSKGYVYFVTNVNKSQFRYERSGKYENASFREVEQKVYANPDFMNKYHWGVFVSTFAWAHHVEIFRFFRQRFLDAALSNLENGNVLDLGAGSGVWSFLTRRYLTGWKSCAVDISATSAEALQKMAASIGLAEGLEVVCADALTWNEKPGFFDAGISCFLLEHLEEPQGLLHSLHRSLRPGGKAFVTGALTAAEIDHIYEFRFESELVRLAEDTGFRVLETLSAAPAKFPQDAKYLPRSMALVLEKKRAEVW